MLWVWVRSQARPGDRYAELLFSHRHPSYLLTLLKYALQDTLLLLVLCLMLLSNPPN